MSLKSKRHANMKSMPPKALAAPADTIARTAGGRPMGAPARCRLRSRLAPLGPRRQLTAARPDAMRAGPNPVRGRRSR